MESAERTGRCMCGAVTYTAKVEPKMSACHCGMCRRWVGGPMLSAGPCHDLTWTAGEDKVTVIESSAWAERGFCSACGSGLFYRITAEGPHHGLTTVSFGTLDDQTGLEIDQEWFIDLKPDAYTLAGDHRPITSAEIARLFGVS